MNPDVLTKIKFPNTKFILHVYAFRKIRPNEIRSITMLWLKQNKRRSLPMSGTGTVITILGFDDQA